MDFAKLYICSCVFLLLASATDGVPMNLWLISHANFRNVFLVGDNVVANIVH